MKVIQMKNNSISEQLTVALVQYDIVWEDPEANRVLLNNMLEHLDPNVDVVILPEAFSTGFSMNASHVAEPMDGKTIQWMRKIAFEKKVALCGSLFIRDKGKVYNRMIWVEASGREVTYDKRHLFSMEKENNEYSPGEKRVVVEYKGWKIFLQICYDLRFPVWSRNVDGYDLVINVASWPASRKDVWITLLKARAIENQCFVAAVNRVGFDANPIVYSGDSLLYDFKGQIVENAGNKSGITVVSIDRTFLYRFRGKFNTLKDADHFYFED